MAFFKSKTIDPAEYTIHSRDGSCTYIKDSLVNNKKKMEELRLLVCPSVPKRKATLRILVVSAKSILDTVSKHVDKFYQTAITTKDVEKFFESIAVIEQDFARMEGIEEYIYYGASPSAIKKNKLDNRLQIEIRHLIDRVYNDAKEKRYPERAKKKAFSDFKPYWEKMDGKSIKKLCSKFGMNPDDLI